MNHRIVIMNGSKLWQRYVNGGWLIYRVRPAQGAQPGIYRL